MRCIYFDYAATTPLSEKVKKILVSYIESDNDFGNSGSSTHEYGYRAKQQIEQARLQIAETLSVMSREIIFTSGATESNNLAIKGVAEKYKSKGNHIITSKTEHKAVLDVCGFLETQGFDVTYLEPDAKGNISINDLKQAITPATILVSLMAVNNELGTKNNLLEIGNLTKKHKIVFHVDAAQGYGKVDIDVKTMNIDLLSVSGHKIYAPKGIGFLYVRSKAPRIKLQKQLHGGAQEFSLRAGTLPTHQVVALATAATEIFKQKEHNEQHLSRLRQILVTELLKISNVKINTNLENSYVGILNITIKDIKAETLLALLRNFALSMGSACNSHSVVPSHVLMAIGLTAEEADASIRISFGTMTTIEQVKFLVKELKQKILLLRSLYPLGGV